ncbi:MAG: MBL fold metallo-hydrolase [Gammaproteobacteria bacterium]|nr:MBL fold metallo-hydrolase [Gammaproteobacteria bacterium]NNF50356.1 MBL fold metallo-hydrolase [Woeseiaceae bacterium]NNL63391.1 MBL fold metallo-hydrolase [Woeseiaceae bacterium]
MNKRARTTVLNDGIVAIDTEYLRPLQDASHLIIEDGRCAFVDTGTNDSVPLLLDALGQQDLDVNDVDYVFLTHIHLDHAGGAGELMRHVPKARCVVHPRGAPHMIDPERLVAGTIAVYGAERTREMYGEIVPIDAARVVVANDGDVFELHGRSLRTLHTEGHARHHYVLHDAQSRGVFTGDSFGISYRELDTAHGEFIFPTTTPASFDPDEAHKSVDRIMACEPRHLYLTHYSRVEDLERLAADMHAGIDAFVELALAHKNDADRAAAIRVAMEDHLLTRVFEHGFAGDREAARAVLEIDIVLNSQGLVAWLERLEKNDG